MAESEDQEEIVDYYAILNVRREVEKSKKPHKLRKILLK